jgi:hypothetical protein
MSQFNTTNTQQILSFLGGPASVVSPQQAAPILSVSRIPKTRDDTKKETDQGEIAQGETDSGIGRKRPKPPEFFKGKKQEQEKMLEHTYRLLKIIAFELTQNHSPEYLRSLFTTAQYLGRRLDAFAQKRNSPTKAPKAQAAKTMSFFHSAQALRYKIEHCRPQPGAMRP